MSSDYVECRSGKRGYASRIKARRANRMNGKRLRPYLCPICHRWHVTHAKTEGH